MKDIEFLPDNIKDVFIIIYLLYLDYNDWWF